MSDATIPKNHRVLVIDDNPAIHDDFRKILSPGSPAVAALDAAELAMFGAGPAPGGGRPMEVESAFQGQEGLERVKQAQAEGRPYALAFLDVRMPPGWDGVETARRLWEVAPDLQIVLCTAYSDYSWGEMFQKLGRRDGLLILKKPFDAVEALQLTHALTEKWALHQQARRKLETLEQAVTERTAKLSRVEELYRRAIAGAGAVAYASDYQTRSYSFMGAEIEQLIGYPAAEVTGPLWQQIIQESIMLGEAAGLAKAEAARRMAAGELRTWRCDMRVRTRDGQVRWISDAAVQNVDEAGRPIGSMGILQDITERKQAEIAAQAFSQLGQRLSAATTTRNAFEVIAAVSRELFGWDAFGIRLYDAKRDLIWAGLTVDTFEGERVAEVQTKPLGVSALYRRIMAEGGELILRDQPTTPVAGLTPFGDVTRPSAALLFVPIRSQGRVLGIMTVQSYTPRAYQQPDLRTLQTLADQCGGTFERIEAEEALRRSEAQLFQAQKLESVGKLAGGIAHEFNSIMTVIIGQSELLLEDLPAGGAGYESAREIRKAGNRAALLTRQLLAYGRKQMLRLEELDLNDVLTHAAGMIRDLLGTTVELQLLPGAEIRPVRVDAGQMEQVIINLAMNAADAMPQGGRLTLQTAPFLAGPEPGPQFPELKPGEYVLLTVTDTGVGMSEEVRVRAFEPFFTTKDVGQGTGLGLATCYGIIKQSGGHITVCSEPGRGTTVKILLPAVAAEPVKAADLPRGTETILLVVRDAELREAGATLLGGLGYHVIAGAAEPGVAASVAWGSRRVDLVCLDAVPPDPDGPEIAQQVQAMFPESRILFVGANPPAAGPSAVELARANCLSKPFALSDLVRAIRAALDRVARPETDCARKSFEFTRNARAAGLSSNQP